MQRRQLPADHRHAEPRLARRLQKLLAVGNLQNQIKAAVVGEQLVQPSEDQRTIVAHRHVDARDVGELTLGRRRRSRGLDAGLRLPITRRAGGESVLRFGIGNSISEPRRRGWGHEYLHC